jgi:hypothetical protein
MSHMADAESAPLREFIQVITLRIERVAQAMDRKTDVLVAEMQNQRAVLEDLVAENRAQREALFRILDRLDGGGTAPAT